MFPVHTCVDSFMEIFKNKSLSLKKDYGESFWEYPV